MKAASADIPHVSQLNAFEVGKWSRFPVDCMYSGGIHEGKQSDEPQGIPTIESRHLPETGRLKVWVRMLSELTCCISPSMIVWGT